MAGYSVFLADLLLLAALTGACGSGPEGARDAGTGADRAWDTGPDLPPARACRPDPGAAVLEVVNGGPWEAPAFTAGVLLPGDVPGVAWGDTATGGLRFSRRVGGLWETASVAPGEAVIGPWIGRSVAAVALPDGRPAVAFYDHREQHLRLAVELGDAWVLETVDPQPAAGCDVAAAVGGDGLLRIAYLDLLRGDLRFAEGIPGDWTVSVLEEEGHVGNDPSLALASGGDVHLAWYACGALGTAGCTLGDLRYGLRSEGIFQAETLDEEGDTGWYASMALGTDGRVHIAYHDHGGGRLRYAQGTGGAWIVETVASGEAAGEFASLVLVDDLPWVAWRDGGAETLRLSHRDAQGDWSTWDLDPGGEGRYASLLAAPSCGLLCAWASRDSIRSARLPGVR